MSSKGKKQTEDASDDSNIEESEAATEESIETSDINAEGEAGDLEKALAELAEYEDKFLRLAAELENTRRRAEIDVANAHKYALDRFAAEIMTVHDSLEQAKTLASGDAQGELFIADPMVQKMLEGLDLTLKQLDKVFKKFHLHIIDPQGDKFDPEQHQAMSMMESDEIEPNHVLHVAQKGCMLHDRLIRPAMVVIAKEKND